jgi:GWxTD domain-containing protein
VLLSAVLFAAAVIRAQDWGASPQAYFMTRAERAQWAALKSDADAQQFIERFVASRGRDFEDEVATRASMADKYLTLGKTAGSKSIRGKVVILLGPPKAVSVADHEVKGDRSSTAGGYINASADGGPSITDVSDAARREGMSGKLVRNYTFTYADFAVTVEADVASGADRVPDSKQAAALEKLFESAAEAPIAVTHPKQ